METTKLDQLYDLRTNFSVIGITGRTGSGCTEIAKILSQDFKDLENIRSPEDFPESVLKKKYEIVHNFISQNWKKYKTIEYKRVLLFLLLPQLYDNPKNKQLFDYFRYKYKEPSDNNLIDDLKSKLRQIILAEKELIEEIKSLSDISTINDNDKYRLLANLFWGNKFNAIAAEIDTELFNAGIIERVVLLHHTANNFRKSGQPFKTEDQDPKYIYKIARVINKIIHGTKLIEDKDGCRIVIDSLRNSLEINFFKERYSAFYLIAVKHDKRKTRLLKEYSSASNPQIEKLLEIDDVEYECNDFQKGKFFTPDVQNCIQKADYHLNNNYSESLKLLKEKSKNGEFQYFFTIEEQLIKLQGLIQQPGLITPDAAERVMQIAFTAKLNSGCISRQVGAVITDNEFATKAIGWNDVPKGSIPCSVRNVKELLNPDSSFGFTEFELGKGSKETEEVNPGNSDNERDKVSQEFHDFVKANYNDKTLPKSALGGINCPYCFKTAYNAFSGDKNQVHTRSLHAEENAMLQISRYGGQGLKYGILFTTASPCELCAKKAYQLGITTIYYIDPYPGISRNHILKSNKEKDPKMVIFSGAVGRAYFKLYEPFMSQKDEIAILTDFNIESPQKIKAKALRNLLSDKLKDNEELKEKLDKALENDDNVFDEFIKLIEKGLEKI